MIQAAVLTILIETFLFILYGYRQKRFLAVVALANLLTNVTLNLAAFLTALLCAGAGWTGLSLYAVIFVIATGELGAVAVEYSIYKRFFEGIDSDILPDTAGGAMQSPDGNPDLSAVKNRNRIIFLQTLSTNAVSFLTGIFILFTWG